MEGWLACPGCCGDFQVTQADADLYGELTFYCPDCRKLSPLYELKFGLSPRVLAEIEEILNECE